MKERSSIKRALVIVASMIFIVVIALFFAWSNGLFYIIERQQSPNQEITATIYSHDVTGPIPQNTGFSLKFTGTYRSATIYTSGTTFENLWWSPCSEYMVMSILHGDERFLELNRFKLNNDANLNAYINMGMSTHDEFASLMTETKHWETLELEFLEWTEEKATMKIRFGFDDYNKIHHTGTLLYNCETEEISDVMFD